MEYGIEIYTERVGLARYRIGGDGELGVRLPLDEAEQRAWELFNSRRAVYVSVGNGEHEIRMWRDDVQPGSEAAMHFHHEGVRWSPWYVDVEINGRRWRYSPLADLNDFDAADELGEVAATLHPIVTRVWTGNVETHEEMEHETREGTSR